MRSHRQSLFISIFVLLATFCSTVIAQTELPRTEIGIQATLPVAVGSYEADTGIGGRLTYNLNKHLAVEGALSFFPATPDNCTSHRCRYFGLGDERLLGVFGVKAGYRYDRFGLFLKARPGFRRLGKFPTDGVCRTQTRTPEGLCVNGVTYFAFDTGGVVEFYPTRRLMFRTDVGTAIIRQNDIYNAPLKGLIQINVGVGVRF
jgi:hypothetical protein